MGKDWRKEAKDRKADRSQELMLIKNLKKGEIAIIPGKVDMTQLDHKIDIPQIRVWVHPKDGGEDRFEIFPSFEEAIEFAVHDDEAEDMIFLAFAGYELNIMGMAEASKVVDPKKATINTQCICKACAKKKHTKNIEEKRKAQINYLTDPNKENNEKK